MLEEGGMEVGRVPGDKRSWSAAMPLSDGGVARRCARAPRPRYIAGGSQGALDGADGLGRVAGRLQRRLGPTGLPFGPNRTKSSKQRVPWQIRWSRNDSQLPLDQTSAAWLPADPAGCRACYRVHCNEWGYNRSSMQHWQCHIINRHRLLQSSTTAGRHLRHCAHHFPTQSEAAPAAPQRWAQRLRDAPLHSASGCCSASRPPPGGSCRCWRCPPAPTAAAARSAG